MFVTRKLERYEAMSGTNKSLAICLSIITKTTSDEQTDRQTENGPTE